MSDSTYEKAVKQMSAIVCVSTFVMVVIYAVTLYKVIKGIPFKRVIAMIIMLMISNVMYFIAGVAEYLFLNDSPYQYFVDKIDATTGPIGDLLFCASHWMFAFYYFVLAKNMPKIIDGTPELLKSYNCFYWVGMIFNCLCPIFELIFGQLYVYNEMKVGDNNHLVNTGLWIASYGVEVGLTISGCILLWSLYKIWNYIKRDSDKSNGMNIKMMALHAVTFVFLIIADAVMLVYYAHYLLHPNVTSSIVELFYSYDVQYTSMFISQTILCLLFYYITKPDDNLEDGNTTAPSLRVTEFDADAELQARVWNSFMRKDRLQSVDRTRTIITSA
jgi:hypothetical protein